MKPFSRKITHWQQNLPRHLESTLFDRNLLRRGDAYDKPLLWVLLCLLCFGLVMVYSASGVQAGCIILTIVPHSSSNKPNLPCWAVPRVIC